jgi:hypothetical protein
VLVRERPRRRQQGPQRVRRLGAGRHALTQAAIWPPTLAALTVLVSKHGVMLAYGSTVGPDKGAGET